MGNPNANYSLSGYDMEPIQFSVDSGAAIKEDEFVLGLFRPAAEDALEPLHGTDDNGIQVDVGKEQ